MKTNLTLDPIPDDDLPAMTPAARRRAGAAILAAGLIRLHERAAFPSEPG